MAWTWIAVVVAATALLAGLALGVWLARNFEWLSTAKAEESTLAIGIDDMEPLIRDAAERWAAAHDRPEASGLVAGKLRTLYDITYGPKPVVPARRWWSR